MLSQLRRIAPLAGLLGASLFASACVQGEGGRCEVDSDCEPGLFCVRGSGLDGVCQSMFSTLFDASPADTAVASDTNKDVSATVDRADAATDQAIDSAPVDARTLDAANPDTATTVDASIDAVSPG